MNVACAVRRLGISEMSIVTARPTRPSRVGVGGLSEQCSTANLFGMFGATSTEVGDGGGRWKSGAVKVRARITRGEGVSGSTKWDRARAKVDGGGSDAILQQNCNYCIFVPSFKWVLGE